MRMKRILSVFLILALILAGCQGGSVSEAEQSPEAASSQPAGQQSAGPESQGVQEKPDFVIYRPPETGDWLSQGIAAFNMAYHNDLHIVFEDFSTGDLEANMERYQSRLAVELMAGTGPDVIFPAMVSGYWINLDLNKAMRNNFFLDLKPYFDQDPNFHAEDYWDNIFDAGCYNGGQYIIPLRIETPLIISNPSKTAEIGIDKVEEDIPAFLVQISQAAVLAQQKPAFAQMMDSKYWFRKFLMYYNIPLIDYESRTVCPDEEALRRLMESYKKYYAFDSGESNDYHTLREEPQSESIYFENDSGVMMVFASSCMKTYGGYTVTPLRDAAGKITAHYGDAAMVRANTKCPEYAYRFIQILLSPTAQENWGGVHKQTMIGEMEHYRQRLTTGKENANGWTYTQLTEEEFQQMTELYNGVSGGGYIVKSDLYYMVKDIMEPFFKDEKTYEACFDELKGKLTLYMDE